MLDTRHKPATARMVATVQRVQRITPHMQRITLGGAEIADFVASEAAGEAAPWVKLFLPCGQGRAYTLQDLNPVAGTLSLDFVLHAQEGQAGPAATWAQRALVGERVGVAGPRSGGVELPAQARWILLAGDATALPAIQSIASRLPAGIQAKAYIEVFSEKDQQPIPSLASLRLQWMNAQSEPGLALCQSLLYRPLPAGPGYIWMAGESAAMRRLRLHYLQERELPRSSVSAKGYWKSGESDHRDT
ncbi:NADPH-dependent ferric siderophore reductase [Comamonas sp. BIGb0152]|uniref:siderophore-interacting protein n=1 Tax=Comamonas sp. BIGb0152 TaxID=2940601 RepID=UPI002167981C|nr:siderophore-interacting protein [Comamonas sp. BIGb0152]MCS4295580.1 NADPH-dependent ferric siderophore reductase [Comamonas sp. BIGb0152]